MEYLLLFGERIVVNVLLLFMVISLLNICVSSNVVRLRWAISMKVHATYDGSMSRYDRYSSMGSSATCISNGVNDSHSLAFCPQTSTLILLPFEASSIACHSCSGICTFTPLPYVFCWPSGMVRRATHASYWSAGSMKLSGAMLQGTVTLQ